MFRDPIKIYLDKVKTYLYQGAQEGGAKIHVDEIAARLSFFYERLRNILDYQEEHLLRKRVIRRIFQRRFFLSQTLDGVSETIIKDIIRSGHLKNDSVLETKIAEVQNIIDRFSFLIEHLSLTPYEERESTREWLVTLAAHAIEETLFPATREALLSELMFFSLKEGLLVTGAHLLEDDINVQLYIAVQRALLRVDDDQLNYRLFQSVYPNWIRATKEECFLMSKELNKIKLRISAQIRHIYANAFFKLCNRYNTVFILIGDLATTSLSADSLEAKLASGQLLEESIAEVYQKRYFEEKARLGRLALFSVISFLISKIAIAIAIEIPIDRYVTNNFSLASTLINIIFPPLLILVITSSIRLPSAKNLKLVIDEAKRVIYPEHKNNFVVKIQGKRGTVNLFFVRLIYFLTSAVSFYLLFKILESLHFSAANIAVFVLFTSLVAATGVKIHNRAKELSLDEEKPTILSFVFDLFMMPFVTIGRWAIGALAKFNILVITVNLIIELPFQFFIDFLENFRSFIKSKKEEMR